MMYYNQSLYKFIKYLEKERDKGTFDDLDINTVNNIIKKARWLNRKLEQEDESNICEAIKKAFDPTNKDISYKNYNYNHGDYNRPRKKKKK